MSVRIAFSDLSTQVYRGDEAVVVDLHQMDESNPGHIHGRLQINIDGKNLALDTYDPSDICFNFWVESLQEMLRKMNDQESASYLVDDGEQGGTPFQFTKVRND